ncbi:MAG TPA: hypothetical protein VF574_18720 [Allosphingosinicella sp.]|jgi:hypothetical protein
MAEPSPEPWSERRIDVAEKYLDRMLAKMESAKADLDKNWLGQIASIAASLALVAGLGSAIANKLLADRGADNALYLVLPLVNSYFFIRFGLIAGVFSKARFYTEKLATELTRRHNLPESLGADQLYQTNSYFEWAHHRFSRATISFLLTIPIVFALNHSLTLYLLFKVAGWSWAYWLAAGVYVIGVATAYVAYYHSNKNNTVVLLAEGRNSFILFTIGIAAIGTVAMLSVLPMVDQDPGPVDFRAGAADSAEHLP